ncbi:MAG TPA: hypothetical protein DIW77_17360 [Chromatiaceae bacterium]|nr:hypothetical protein [Chromatiaceae bacterium]
MKPDGNAGIRIGVTKGTAVPKPESWARSSTHQHALFLGDCRREIHQLAPDSRSPSPSGNKQAEREDKPDGLFLHEIAIEAGPV